ncbi:MAG: DUF4935 domain-containing protein [Rhodobacteraceae bacterium]|nr:DUF4935 domain-containing protein [Paracoccaceae bacterium]MCB1469578.1 DUF4935 domain-containing protein [Rhizobiaceae bacterium]
MNLFIDANIFLDFYHLSGGDIEELKKLVALIEEGDIVLFTSKQLQEEVRRNRDTKIFDALKEFQKASFKVSFPAFCKHYPEYAEIQEALKTANSKHSQLLTKSTGDIKAENLNADTLISDLFSKSKDIPVSQAIFNASINRFRLGNPPGKKKVTMGDEVNWECLIEGVPQIEELHFVSGDGDYASAIFPEELNAFLQSEWKQKKESEICFYKSITDFFKKKFPDIKLASDIKVNKLIEKLAASGSFAITHVVISELSKQAQFSKVQVEELVSILDLNTQVSWIIEDLDVKTFYRSILEKYGEIVSAPARQTLNSLLFPEPEVPDMDEEIPF